MAIVPSRSTFAPPARSPEPHRPGYSLMELIVALSIFAVVTALLYGALAAQVRLARATTQRAAAGDAVRTASHVLAGEARRMSSADVRAADADSVALRSFRGSAIVCAATAPGKFNVRYRGDRAPDANKDSVLVISATAPPLTAALEVAGIAQSDSCVPLHGEAVMSWTVMPATDSAAIMLVFESGTYYISSRALRYRRGAEGRQPLTAELLAQPPSGLTAGADALIATLATGRSSGIRVVAPFGSWQGR